MTLYQNYFFSGVYTALFVIIKEARPVPSGCNDSSYLSSSKLGGKVKGHRARVRDGKFILLALYRGATISQKLILF
jgi:hypothetical protein